MPVISVSMTKENGGLSKAQKQKLISGLTSAFVDVVGRGDKTCVVVINEVECQNYGIDGVNIEIPEGKVTAIVGASGSGKTTLIKLMLGLIVRR